jgi:hypothetical protein
MTPTIFEKLGHTRLLELSLPHLQNLGVQVCFARIWGDPILHDFRVLYYSANGTNIKTQRDIIESTVFHPLLLIGASLWHYHSQPTWWWHRAFPDLLRSVPLNVGSHSQGNLQSFSPTWVWTAWGRDHTALLIICTPNTSHITATR